MLDLISASCIIGISMIWTYSEYGESEISVPRDLDGEHEPIIIKKHQKILSGIEDQIIAMYSKGMTVRDIQDHLNQLYGIEVSPTLISNVTNKLMPIIKEWQNRPLEKTYDIVFMDALHYKIRQEGAIVNKAAYMVIGIDMDGRKDVLGMWIGEHETANFWLVVLNELRNRGVQDHRQLRKVTKGKTIFPNDESLQKKIRKRQNCQAELKSLDF